MKRDRIKAYISLLIVAAIWGIAGPVIKVTLPDYPPLIFLTYRFFISVLILAPIMFVLKPKWPSNQRDFWILTTVGLMGSTINLGLTFYGFNYSTVLDATLLSDISPIFVVAAGAIFLKEKVTKQEKIGVVITFLGALAITIQPLFEGNLNSGRSIFGNFLIILANISWVIYAILSKYTLKEKVDPLLMTTYMFFLGLITTLPFAIIESGSIPNLLLSMSSAPLSAHLGVWYMAILSGALAYFLYQYGQKLIEASEAALFTYLTPVFAAPLAVFWLHEKITLPFIVGTFIVLIGVFIAEYKKKHKNDVSSDE